MKMVQNKFNSFISQLVKSERIKEKKNCTKTDNLKEKPKNLPFLLKEVSHTSISPGPQSKHICFFWEFTPGIH